MVFVEPTDVDGGDAIYGSHGTVAVGVVDKLADNGRALLDCGQPVFVVEVDGVGCAADGAAGLVAN